MRTIVTIFVLIACAAVAGCRESPPPSPPAAAPAPAPPDPAIAEAAAAAALPIRLDQALGSDLQLVGLSVAARPGGTSWEMTLHSKVLHKQNPRPQLWVHAYPPESHDYFIVNPTGNFPSADVGRIVKDGFLLPKPGAFNLYAGVMQPDGGYGPAVSLGWVGVGDPASKEYQKAYDFLLKANDARAAVMAEQARHDYPSAR